MVLSETIINALVSPVEKLIESVRFAIGKSYEPKHIRKVAESKSFELQLISDTVRNNYDIPILYNSDGITIDTRNFEELAMRTSQRLAFQELSKQQNIETVVDHAYEILQKEDAIPDESVKSEWMSRFFNSVEDISDTNMQELWGHLLAGEIKQPGKYSYRTMDKLKNLNSDEAKLFHNITTLILIRGQTYFLYANNEILNKYGVHFRELLTLEECGLMSVQALKLHIPTDEKILFFS